MTYAHMSTLVDNRTSGPCHIGVYAARNGVRGARRVIGKAVDAVQVYATTDRTGTPVHVAYVHYRPGYWDNVRDVADIYEIPTAALLDL